jgi:[ribosomal protein S5]-alanine N-acetyltransferase
MKIKIREYKMSDLDNLCDLFIDDEVLDGLGGSLTEKNVNGKMEKSWLRKTISRYNQKKPESLSWAIEVDGEYVGGIGIHRVEWKDEKSEIGYWIGKPFWGRGIATEALKQFIKFLDRKYDFKRISALVFSYNLASQRVLKKAGFKFEGLLRKNAKKNGRFCDDKLYSRVK